MKWSFLQNLHFVGQKMCTLWGNFSPFHPSKLEKRLLPYVMQAILLVSTDILVYNTKMFQLKCNSGSTDFRHGQNSTKFQHK